VTLAIGQRAGCLGRYLEIAGDAVARQLSIGCSRTATEACRP